MVRIVLLQKTMTFEILFIFHHWWKPCFFLVHHVQDVEHFAMLACIENNTKAKLMRLGAVIYMNGLQWAVQYCCFMNSIIIIETYTALIKTKLGRNNFHASCKAYLQK